MAGSNKPVDLNGQVVNALPVAEPVILNLPPVDLAGYYQVMPAQPEAEPNIQQLAEMILALENNLVTPLPVSIDLQKNLPNLCTIAFDVDKDIKEKKLQDEFWDNVKSWKHPEKADFVGDLLDAVGDFI